MIHIYHVYKYSWASETPGISKKERNSSRGSPDDQLVCQTVKPVQLCGYLISRATNNQKPVISTNYSIKHKRFKGVIKTSSYYIQYQNKKEVTFLKELCKNGNSKINIPRRKTVILELGNFMTECYISRVTLGMATATWRVNKKKSAKISRLLICTDRLVCAYLFAVQILKYS